MRTTDIDGIGMGLIVTEGMIDGRTGKRIYGVFATLEDARQMDADRRALAILGEDQLTEEQRIDAAYNAAKLGD